MVSIQYLINGGPALTSEFFQALFNCPLDRSPTARARRSIDTPSRYGLSSVHSHGKMNRGHFQGLLKETGNDIYG
jgi:hypothetical protein